MGFGSSTALPRRQRRADGGPTSCCAGVIYSVFMFFMAGIDNIAHVGGLIAGGVLGSSSQRASRKTRAARSPLRVLWRRAFRHARVVRRRGVDVRRHLRGAATIGAVSGLSGSDPGAGMGLSERLEYPRQRSSSVLRAAPVVTSPYSPAFARRRRGRKRVVPHIDRQVTPGGLAIAQQPSSPVALPPRKKRAHVPPLGSVPRTPGSGPS